MNFQDTTAISDFFLPDPMVKIFAVIGFILLPLTLIITLMQIFSPLKKIAAWSWNRLSDFIKVKRLEKKAISSGIEATINCSVDHLQKQMPVGWFYRTSLKWIKEQKPAEFKDGELIIRLRPKVSQDSNLFLSLFLYFDNSIFPDTREIIPKDAYNATVIQLSKRVIIENIPTLVEKFENEIVENEVKKDSKLLDYLEGIDNIDGKGFFTSSFLREVDQLANYLRFKSERKEFRNEILKVLQHTNDFVNALPEVPDNLWLRKGIANSYQFLLVKNPKKFWHRIYVKRAQKAAENGVEHLYVLGSNWERSFVNKVITLILKQTKYNLVERFELNQDFRGQKNGLGAFFSLNAEL